MAGGLAAALAAKRLARRALLPRMANTRAFSRVKRWAIGGQPGMRQRSVEGSKRKELTTQAGWDIVGAK